MKYQAKKLYITEATAKDGTKMRFEQREADMSYISALIDDKNSGWKNGGQMTPEQFEAGKKQMIEQGMEITETTGEAY